MLKSGLLDIGAEARSRLLAEESIETQFTVETQPFARGKFAAVRRAFRSHDSSIFAAKYVRKRRRVSTEEIWHEVCVLNLSRDCPFIVNLYQVFETPLDIILMLEMAEGGDLQTLLDTEECLEESTCVDILRDTLKGLSFLHQHSIAHLDIKPANLLVVTGSLPLRHVKLCDFGLSRHLSKTTEVRELFGTTEYMSPEILNYEPLTLAVDMWSVGVLLYVLLSGLSPFGASSKQETYLNISTISLSFPPPYFSGVSSGALSFIQKLLLVSPAERMSVEECLNDEWLNNGGDAGSENSKLREPNNNKNPSTITISSQNNPPPSISLPHEKQDSSVLNNVNK